MANDNIERIVFPRFVFEDGREGMFVGYLRGVEPLIGGVRLSVYDKDGNYYGVQVDPRARNKRKRPTHIVEGRFFHHKIKAFYTYGTKVNPSNGHLLCPHDCGDPSCESKVLLYGEEK